ncbi:HAD family hydrolase [Micropruina sp.]|uniref:HAD family hydrolase n=1 Tax=Micropruina sp. TaxID=2737536 RepID=UPI0039E5797C
MTQAVIFDLDGTLTNTEAVWHEQRRTLLAGEGKAWSESDSMAIMGMSTPEWSGYMFGTAGFAASAEEAAQRTIDSLLDRYRHDLPVLPGAREAVRRLAENWPLAVASSSPPVLIERALEAMGVRELFAVVRSTEQGSARGKPSPDAFLAAAEQLGSQPAHTVVVEDSGNGILAGLNAGMPVVAIPPHFLPPSAEILGRAAAVLDSLDALTVDLVRRVGA